MQGKPEEAMKEFNFVIRIWPNCARGECFVLSLYTSSLCLVLKVRDSCPAAYFERGNIRYELEDWEASAQDYTAAITNQDRYLAGE
jgi:tetratricopeptide (TPR) repeat protein